jgi:hypothetical protein
MQFNKSKYDEEVITYLYVVDNNEIFTYIAHTLMAYSRLLFLKNRLNVIISNPIFFLLSP